MIELNNVNNKKYENGCMCCNNIVGLKELVIGSQKKNTSTILCHLCRTALVGQLIDIR